MCAAGPIGTVLNDTATVTGGSNPTGSIDFALYGPNNLTCDPAGAARSEKHTAELHSRGPTTSPLSPTQKNGTYNRTATYADDANNISASSCFGSESVIVANHGPPFLPTRRSSDLIGTVLNDTATVTGGSNPTGSIDFALYGPNNLTCDPAGAARSEERRVGKDGNAGTTTPG